MESVTLEAKPQTAADLKDVDLTSRAMLAHPRIGTWTKSKKDKEITHEVVTQHAASKDAGKWMKNLAGSRPPKEAMTAARTAFEKPYEISRNARAYHHYMTRAWLDDGKRLLDIDLLDEYIRKMDDLQDQFDRAVEQLVQYWPTFVQDALSDQGTTGKPADYPKQSEIGEYFYFGYMISMLPKAPTAADFRSNVSEVQIERIKRQVEESLTQSILASRQSEIESAIEVVAKLAKGLRDYEPPTDGQRAKGGFHKTLVTNVKDLSKHLRHVNITDDPLLDQIAADIEASLTKFDSETLKGSAEQRERIAAEADRITESLSPFIA